MRERGITTSLTERPLAHCGAAGEAGVVAAGATADEAATAAAAAAAAAAASVASAAATAAGLACPGRRFTFRARRSRCASMAEMLTPAAAQRVSAK
jgi:hypothetical protein